MISKEIVIKTIHQFFYEQIEKTPLITDEDGEHYITAKVEPFLEMNKDLSKLINSIPDQDRRGRWVDDRCSECSQHNPVYKVIFRGVAIWEIEGQSNYCPNCGAKMEE